MILLGQNAMWLACEYLFMDWDKPWKFRILRAIYFGFLGFTRVDIVDNFDADDKYWKILYKAFKMFFVDFFSMLFIVWTFGCTYMNYVAWLECAFVLATMIFPERICTGHYSFLN